MNRNDQHLMFGYRDLKGSMSKSTFRTGIKELEEHGLIEIVDPGEFPNRKGIYALSDRWRDFEDEEEEDIVALPDNNPIFD